MERGSLTNSVPDAAQKEDPLPRHSKRALGGKVSFQEGAVDLGVLVAGAVVRIARADRDTPALRPNVFMR